MTSDDDDAERCSVYIPEDGESYELESYLKDIKENDELSSEAVEDIECEASALDWIYEYVDSGADLIPETEVHYIYQNKMFLTKAEAKEKENDSEVIAVHQSLFKDSLPFGYFY
ncbi:hypothetical protein [Bacillus halotolerans]|uniref:hypothetical protein n=1 Tax=Bacillus halotolerans TaxID=260554 RepID=UPI0038294A61